MKYPSDLSLIKRQMISLAIDFIKKRQISYIFRLRFECFPIAQKTLLP